MEMAALPARSSASGRPLAALDRLDDHPTYGEIHEQHGDRVPSRWFDADALAALGSIVPSDLQVWRLRLRFGLATRVALGESFRVAVDLVDEMGQPPPPRALVDVGRSLRPPRLQLLAGRREGDCAVAAGASPLALRVVEAPGKAVTKWAYDVVIDGEDAAAAASVIEGACSLLVALDAASAAATSSSAFHRALGAFCAHSVWLSDCVLVLPLQSEEIHVERSPGTSLGARPATTACARRLFSVPTRPMADSGERRRQLLAITENYGDAMGAHVWDASILLSLALIEAAPRSPAPVAAMMELGAGCGLFACVFRALYAAGASAMVFTERAESVALLECNVKRAEGASASAEALLVEVVPLVWGQLPLPPAVASRADALGVAFAADVLYHWDAHAALLSTLTALSSASTQDAGFHAVIAHKHRGAATSRALDAVLARSSERSLGASREEREGDAWRWWRVERLARLGKVDLLRLTRRR